MHTFSHSQIVTIFSCALALGFSFGAPAATFSLNPAADAFVTTGPSGSLSGNNYGGAGSLGVSAPGLSQGEFQSVLQFNLLAARNSFDATYGVGGWSIQSISLQSTAASPNNAIFNANAAGQFRIYWMQNDGWIEGSGTPQAPTTTGITFSTISNFVSGADENLGQFNYNGLSSGNSTFALNLTASFSADVLSGNLASMRLLAADSSVSYLSDSRSFGTTTARPLLTIVAVPEPGSAGLAMAGLVGLAVVRLRRSRG